MHSTGAILVITGVLVLDDAQFVKLVVNTLTAFFSTCLIYGTVKVCCAFDQWRSKSLRGPGSTVTCGPSLSLPSTSPSLPFPSSFPPLPQPSPSPAMKRPPNRARGLGERCKLPSGVWGRAPAEIEFGAF